jgi:hypothetical protein
MQVDEFGAGVYTPAHAVVEKHIVERPTLRTRRVVGTVAGTVIDAEVQYDRHENPSWRRLDPGFLNQ